MEGICEFALCWYCVSVVCVATIQCVNIHCLCITFSLFKIFLKCMVFLKREWDSPVKITINSVNEKPSLSVAPAITSTKVLTGWGRSTAARLLRLWVRIPPGAWTFVCYECCVLSGRGLCDELITHPEESYRLWPVVVCDLETSKEEAKSPLKDCKYKPTTGCEAEKKKGTDSVLLEGIQLHPNQIN